MITKEKCFKKIIVVKKEKKIRCAHLTLFRAGPPAISNLTFYRVLKGWWIQILVAASYLTLIDTRQKDLQFSDAKNHPN